MQQRRFRPGDVLDDYCPRERRITDHAIVAMIDDHIKQTRCVVCDAEHEYKEGKVPPQRRKRPQAALFSQVLDNLQGPQPTARLAHHTDAETEPETADVAPEKVIARVAPVSNSDNGHHSVASVKRISVPPSVVVDPPPPVTVPLVAAPPDTRDDSAPRPEEGSVRRPLIRATLPRPEGQPVAARVLPEFTIRQPTNARGGQRPGGRRRGGHQPQGEGPGSSPGPMRFGRGGQGHGQGGGQSHGQGQRQQQGGRPHRPNGGRSGSRRGGKQR